MKKWHELAGDIEDSRFGIICPDGLFYPCDYQGHINLADRMVDAGFLNEDGKASFRTYLQVERVCIMISSLPMTMAKRMTPRQKLTLERFIDHHKLFDEKDFGAHRDIGFYLADQSITLVNGRAQCKRA